jgi:acetoin utilization deacetylase AcuC-like enzyme
MKLLTESGLLTRRNITLLTPEPATQEDLVRIHSQEYIEQVKSMSKIGKGYVDLPRDGASKKPKSGTPVVKGTYEIAKLSAGGGIVAGNVVAEGKADNAFALIRPPGHHAGKNYGAGYCYFNNIAIMIENLREKHRMKRFMILDLDVHHGNGTQDIFYEDPTVLCFHTHQAHLYPVYKTKGDSDEIGCGEGKGYNINVPFPPEATGEDYLYVIDQLVVPVAEAFQPDIICVSSGLDMHFTDLLGSIKLTTQTYAVITQRLMDVAERICKGKIALLLEGGYNLEAVPRVVATIIATLAELGDAETSKYIEYKSRRLRKQISAIKKTISRTHIFRL